MVFSSEIFLFFFMPVFFAVYFLTPKRLRSLTILLGSYGFYGWWRLDFLLLLIATTLFAFLIGKKIEHHRNRRAARIYLILGVSGCLAVLGVFKYLNFFMDSLTGVFGTTPEDIGVHWRLILPIGISFYVFQAVSYLIDLYRQDARSSAHWIDFAAFIALFPQLIAGPILRYKDLEHQFRQRDHSLDNFSQGLLRFLIGLGKKVLLADSLAPLVDTGFGAENPAAVLAWAAALAFALQLYFDFSGYSDMAIGLGRMMGFHFPENFKFPYISRSITEFWQRWHISLSTWLRDYLYIPLGGNRQGHIQTYRNLILVMLLGGLWHGANWTFVLWGLWHGAFLAFERQAMPRRKSARPAFMANGATLLAVLLGWVMFRADTVAQAWVFYQSMLGVHGIIPAPHVMSEIGSESVLVCIIAVGVVLLEPHLSRTRTSKPQDSVLLAKSGEGFVMSRNYTAVFTLFVAVAAILKLAEQSFSPFLYFQF